MAVTMITAFSLRAIPYFRHSGESRNPSFNH